jgi:sugar lactone lactonase YvrE
VAVDAVGNLFIADTFHHRVRKVSPDGIITTAAGVGPRCPGSNNCLPLGDGGPATNATLSVPTAVAIDAKGNLFIADIGDSLVRKVSADGFISTVAGNGTYGSSGDGGPATSAKVVPNTIVVDSAGALIIAGGGQVRRVSLDGTIVTVSTGYAGTADSQGNLFIVASYRR